MSGRSENSSWAHLDRRPVPSDIFQLSSLERGGVSHTTICRADEMEFCDGAIQDTRPRIDRICPAFDTAQGRQLNLEEKKQTARTEWITGEGEHPLGMEVMAMFNISTDLDVMNGARTRSGRSA